MRFTLLILAAVVFQTAIAQETEQASLTAEITFEQEIHEFGNIPEGPQVSTDFIFKNTGTEPLVLTNVKASCGCTVPTWPKEPIMPGETGIIKATYNTKNRPGSFNKSITITSNAKTAKKIVYIKGTVEKINPDDHMPVKKNSSMMISN